MNYVTLPPSGLPYNIYRFSYTNIDKRPIPIMLIHIIDYNNLQIYNYEENITSILANSRAKLIFFP